MSRSDKAIDVTGVSCPTPLIQIAKAVDKLEPGQVLEITGDDPVFERGVRDFCEARNFELLEVRKESGHQLTILIKR